MNTLTSLTNHLLPLVPRIAVAGFKELELTLADSITGECVAARYLDRQATEFIDLWFNSFPAPF